MTHVSVSCGFSSQNLNNYLNDFHCTMSLNVKHGQQEITDPLEEMLKRTGCIELHYKVQDCIAEKEDWRMCQEPVKLFKECMLAYTEKQRQQMPK